MHATIRTELEAGLDAGESTAKLAARVKATFNTMSKARATVIAKTETSAAYGTARQEAMQQAGVAFKGWLTSGNSNVRAAHRAANGQTVPIDQDFIVDGESLSHPGDPKGSPGNVISCHCISIPKAAEEENPDN